ncbi:LytR family transcriptional regulator [Candidatus Gottesmanbacteria bacterium]|nr:LytR family transcriptional regulator [Candidatus Gottesmanbacteria bacterium]
MIFARLTALLFVVILGTVSFLSFIAQWKIQPGVIISPLARTVSAQSLSSGQVDQEKTGANKTPSRPSGRSGNKINILLLGLDARRGDKNPRCDAIHLLSFDPDMGKIVITSVPRGILVNLPGIEKESRYLGNACHLLGVDFAVGEIEKISQIHPDYIVKIEFSQVLGILRSLGLPTTPTLQFLRSRQYPRGDYQRSHNQAVFIKDMLVARTTQFAQLPKPVQYLLFRMLNTDIDFDKALDLVNQLIRSGATADASRIELITKPNLPFALKELHFPEEKFSDASVWLNDQDYQTYQKNLATYLQNLIIRAEKLYQANKISQAYQLLTTPFKQQLWLQIEDSDKRNLFHFAMLKFFILTSPNRDHLPSLVHDFIAEMEIANQVELKGKAQELLETVSQ